MAYTEKDILHELDLAFNTQPSAYFPEGEKGGIKYNFFLDLEHGYCETAGNRIHLYADAGRWAIIFEKCGYQNRGGCADITLDYVGNCIRYFTQSYGPQKYISNSNNIVLIEGDEYERVCNDSGDEMETFELISPEATEITIHGQVVPIEHDTSKYIALGIQPREYDNPNNLISYEDIVRYFSDTNPALVSATEEELRVGIPENLPRLMTLDQFHYSSSYDKENPPSEQEMYQLIAQVLVSKDTSLWKPTLPANNHWSNWESGNL